MLPGENGGDPTAQIDTQKEKFKLEEVDEHQDDPTDIQDFYIENICSVQQLEIYHKMLITDVYRREYAVDFSKFNENINKKYFILPLILDHDCRKEGKLNLTYRIDKKLLAKVENIHKYGYPSQDMNIIDWLQKKELFHKSNSEE